MGVGDHIAVGGHDDAGADGGTVPLLGHHQHGGGIHLGIDLLGRQLRAMAAGDGQLHRRIVVVHPGDGGVVVGKDVHDAAGVVVFAVIGAAVVLGLAQDGEQHHDHCHHRHDAQEDPEAQALFLLGRLGRRGTDAFRQRLMVDVVIHHLLPLLGNVPIHHLLWFVSVSQFIHMCITSRCCGGKSAAG